MSEAIDKITTKTFKSSTLLHLGSYPAVKSVIDYLLSFALLSSLWQYVSVYLKSLNDNVISKNDYLYKGFTFVDSNFDRIVLSRVDTLLTKLPDLSPYYPTTLYHKSATKLNKSYLAPVNSFIYSTYDKYLPATATDNKVAFKLEEFSGAEDSIKTEFVKFFKIVNEFLVRSRLLVSSKTSELGENVVNKYNDEFEKLEKEGNYYYKSGQASYNTGVNLINDVNSSYIQPLKSQTQGYVTDARTKADTFIADAKNKADHFLSDAKGNIELKFENAQAKSQEFVNGAAPVSASA